PHLALKFLQGIDVSFPTTSCNNWLGWKRPPADMEAPPHQRAAAPGFRSISLPCRASAETPVPAGASGGRPGTPARRSANGLFRRSVEQVHLGQVEDHRVRLAGPGRRGRVQAADEPVLTRL